MPNLFRHLPAAVGVVTNSITKLVGDNTNKGKVWFDKLTMTMAICQPEPVEGLNALHHQNL